MEQQREALLGQIWAAQDEAYDLMYEYDSLPHRYGAHILYQSEAHIIDLIGEHPEITVTELAAILKKTPSACSQIVRKLRAKGWVEQVRNAENNRIYNLYLTESGKQVYQAHTAFNQSCQEATFQLLSNFSPEELEHHLMVQRKLNEAYQDDVRRSRDYDRPASLLWIIHKTKGKYLFTIKKYLKYIKIFLTYFLFIIL